MSDPTDPKGSRSPSFPFISLRKAEERAKAFWEKHRRESARVAAVAPTWDYGVKSSGFAQTISAMKHFGLIDVTGSGDDRRLQLSNLGQRLVADQREGAREAALKEAALRPRLFKGYERWIDDPPSVAHRLSELELDRGFNADAARAFVRAFDETVAYAGLKGGDKLSSTPPETSEAEEETNVEAAEPLQGAHNNIGLALAGPLDPARLSVNQGPNAPLAQRLKVEMTVNALSVTAVLTSAAEVGKLIAMLQAMTPLLPAADVEQPH